MKASLLVCLFVILYRTSFGCSCILPKSACENLNNEYNVSVIVSFKNLSRQAATLIINKVISDEIILNEEYHIFADSVTSCSTTLENVEEWKLYYFGFPKDRIPNDTIGYYQCMSPFYDVLKSLNLSSCNSKPLVESVNIYPNPIQGNKFFITRPIQNLSSLSIFDIRGQLVDQKKFDSSTEESFSLPDSIDSGIYFIILTTDRGVKYQSKLVA